MAGRVLLDPAVPEWFYDYDGPIGFSVANKANVLANVAALIKRFLKGNFVLGAGYNAVGTAGATGTVTLAGAAIGDVVIICFDGATGTVPDKSVDFAGYVASANTVTVNATASAAGPFNLSTTAVQVFVIGLT
jgi:hypothetical protein